MAYIQINLFSKSLMRTVPINVILPIDKLDVPGMPVREKKPYKTLYLLHGIFGNCMDWNNCTRIQAWAQEKNLAVVMPSGDNHFYVDHQASGERYGEFIGKELVELTRDMLPLSHNREDTYIGGLSMGGYGSLRNGLKYADTFGCIAALSSALIQDMVITSTDDSPVPIQRRSYYEFLFGNLDNLVGSDMDCKALVASQKAAGTRLPDIYLACGTEDFLIEPNRDFKKYLDEQGVPCTYVEGPGAHTWEFWDTYIKKVLDWLPLEEATESVHSGNVK